MQISVATEFWGGDACAKALSLECRGQMGRRLPQREPGGEEKEMKWWEEAGTRLHRTSCTLGRTLDIP